MTLGDVMSGEHRPQLVEAVVRDAAWGRGGDTAVACKFRNTKLLELRFRAVLDEDGTRQIALARA
jgi:hypothetical protein